jgi:putative tryptophan/tyrosine transport system substrate-binding protein
LASYIARRKFLATLLGGAAVPWPLAARVQQTHAMRRVGVLMPFVAGDPEAQLRSTVLAQSLQQSGWTVGRNLQIDYRFPGGEADRIRQCAAVFRPP